MPLSLTDPNGAVVTLTNDERQRLLSRTVAGETTVLKKVTSPDGSFVSYGYDDAHRLTSLTDTDGNTITYTLNAAGQRLTEEVRDAQSTLTYRRTRVYNALGRLVEEEGEDEQLTSYGYDLDGNLTEIEDPLGRVTSQEYDELDRLATLIDAALQETAFSYDGQDNLLSVLDPKSSSATTTRVGAICLQLLPRLRRGHRQIHPERSDRAGRRHQHLCLRRRQPTFENRCPGVRLGVFAVHRTTDPCRRYWQSDASCHWLLG